MSVIEARWSRDAHLRGLHCCLGEVPRLLRQRCLTSLRLVCSALDEGLMCWQGSGDGLGAAGLARGGAGRTRFPTPPSEVVVGVSSSQVAAALSREGNGTLHTPRQAKLVRFLPIYTGHLFKVPFSH